MDKNFFLGESTKELRVFIILRGIKFIGVTKLKGRGEEGEKGNETRDLKPILALTM